MIRSRAFPYSFGPGVFVAVRVAVLGPVRGWRDGAEMRLGPPKQRELLAVLVLAGERTVPIEGIIDALWDDEPPASAVSIVRTYVSLLRKAIGHEHLVSRGRGYALTGVGTDLADFERLTRQGAYREALELWTGEPPGLRGPHLRRLEEARLLAIESACAQDLDSGQAPGQVLAELAELSARYPLRERLRALLMRALAAGGRRPEALAVFADLRQTLADELGIDPSPEVAELFQRLLSADDVPAPAAMRVPARPAQLPPVPADFTGRAELVAGLVATLAARAGQAPMVTVMTGIGGVGKTTLAVRAAHAVREHFPDGQLFADLQGAGTAPADPAAVLAAFLRALGVADELLPETLEERAALFRSTVADRRVLVVLDNAHDRAQVLPLLPGSSSCRVLVTSRARPYLLPGAGLVEVDVPPTAEALALLERIVGTPRVAAETADAEHLVELCGRLPLAVRVAGARLATRHGWPIRVMVDKLADESKRLGALRTADVAVSAAFELSYRQLDPSQARAFRLLALSQGPDLPLAAAAAMLDLSEVETEDLVESLVDLSLLESPSLGRYRYHDLLRAYARSLAEPDRPALARLLEHYLATAGNAFTTLNPGDPSAASVTAEGGLTFDTIEAATAWVARERDCLIRVQAVDLSSELQILDLILLLAYESNSLVPRFHDLAARAATAGEVFVEGRARASLAHVLRDAGRLDDAIAECAAALEVTLRAGDMNHHWVALSTMGVIQADRHDRQDVALDSYRQAAAGFHELGERYQEAAMLYGVGQRLASLERYDEAIETLHEAETVMRAHLGDDVRDPYAVVAMAKVYTRAGRHHEALPLLREALALFRQRRNFSWEQSTLIYLVRVLLALDRAAEALPHAEAAVVLAEERRGGGWADGASWSELGQVLHALRQHSRARSCWERALELYEQFPAKAAEVRALLERPVPRGPAQAARQPSRGHENSSAVGDTGNAARDATAAR
ncbi:BTAD domain-containing putative transcriptional regulator [Nonomuraea sp. NPDC004354]